MEFCICSKCTILERHSMNIVDRIFIMIVLLVGILMLYSPEYNLLHYLTEEELLLVISIFVLTWQLFASICEYLTKHLYRTKKTKKPNALYLPPIAKEKTLALVRNEYIVEFEPTVDQGLESIENIVDKLPERRKDARIIK